MLKQFLSIMARYLKPYRKYLGWSVVLNFLSQWMNVFSFMVLIPILNILFKIDQATYTYQPFKWNKDVIINNAYAWIQELMVSHGAFLTLVLMGIALVGQSGSGKSTLVDLVPRYHDVKEGEVLIDGKNIKGVRISELRALIGNVNQEAILFNDTFYNNITFGVDNATMEQVIEAAKIANAHDFIMESEHGYDTMIGDRGGRLSGGQRQRVSIARAILKTPPILILDEATAALDTESERLVQEALERLMKSRTTIAIAHRLSTIKNADEIYVLYEGEIVECGQHEELIAKNGYYKRLYDMQQL